MLEQERPGAEGRAGAVLHNAAGPPWRRWCPHGVGRTVHPGQHPAMPQRDDTITSTKVPGTTGPGTTGAGIGLRNVHSRDRRAEPGWAGILLGNGRWERQGTRQRAWRLARRLPGGGNVTWHLPYPVIGVGQRLSGRSSQTRPDWPAPAGCADAGQAAQVDIADQQVRVGPGVGQHRTQGETTRLPPTPVGADTVAVRHRDRPAHDRGDEHVESRARALASTVHCSSLPGPAPQDALTVISCAPRRPARCTGREPDVVAGDADTDTPSTVITPAGRPGATVADWRSRRRRRGGSCRTGPPPAAGGQNGVGDPAVGRGGEHSCQHRHTGLRGHGRTPSAQRAVDRFWRPRQGTPSRHMVPSGNTTSRAPASAARVCLTTPGEVPGRIGCLTDLRAGDPHGAEPTERPGPGHGRHRRVPTARPFTGCHASASVPARPAIGPVGRKTSARRPVPCPVGGGEQGVHRCPATLWWMSAG